MKSLFAIVFAGMFFAPAFTQEDSGTVINADVVTFTDNEENVVVTVGADEIVVFDETKDTTKVKIGKKGIIIIEGDKGTEVHIEKDDIEDFDEEFDEDFDEDNGTKRKKFKPNWAGFEVGLNNYVNSDMSMSLSNDMNFMDLNTGRSWNFNVNIMEYGFGLGTDKIGLVTGLGFEMTNYHFDGNNSITKDAAGQIVLLDLSAYSDIQKNKLQTTYLRAPLLLEVQIPAGKKRIYLSAGPVAGVKLGSSTKLVYKEGGDKQKIKDKDDFNIASLRYGFTARAGYRDLRLFANYYMTPLFEADKGPELYPFSVGLTLVEF